MTRLRPFLIILEESRFAPIQLLHRVQMAGCSRVHSFPSNPSRSFRTPHFRHSLHHMTDRTWYHHPSSSSSPGVSWAKCTSGMKKISAPAAFSNASLSPMSFKCNSCSRLCFLASDCHPRICARNSSDSPGAIASPSFVTRLRTSLTFSTKLSPKRCMLTLTTLTLVLPFACNLCA